MTPETVRALLDGATPGKYTLDPHSDMDDCLYDIWCGDQNGICVAENMLHRDACLFLAAPNLARAYLAVCEERDELRKGQTYRYIGKDGKTVLARDLEDERDAAIERATIAHERICELVAQVDAAHAEGIAEGMERAAVILAETSDTAGRNQDGDFYESEEAVIFSSSVCHEAEMRIRAAMKGTTT